MIRAHFIGGAVAALAIATAAGAVQTAPPPGVAQGTAPAPMAMRPPLPPVAPLPPMVAPPMMMMHSDHVMTREEVVKHVRELFARLDTNRDGFITKQEVEAFHQKFAGMAQMGQDMAEHARGMAEMGRAMGERYSDHGMAMPDRGAMFDRLDTNHDGMISREEFMAGKPEVREQRVMIMRGPDGAPDTAMPPMDGHPEMKMEMRMHHMDGMGMGGMGKGGMGMGGMGMHLFEMADTNHDGRVSLAEAEAAALAHFDKADLNHDGKITPDEHQQIREKIRIERRSS